jgi:hypothetical protein
MNGDVDALTGLFQKYTIEFGYCHIPKLIYTHILMQDLTFNIWNPAIRIHGDKL